MTPTTIPTPRFEDIDELAARNAELTFLTIFLQGIFAVEPYSGARLYYPKNMSLAPKHRYILRLADQEKQVIIVAHNEKEAIQKGNIWLFCQQQQEMASLQESLISA